MTMHQVSSFHKLIWFAIYEYSSKLWWPEDFISSYHLIWLLFLDVKKLSLTRTLYKIYSLSFKSQIVMFFSDWILANDYLHGLLLPMFLCLLFKLQLLTWLHLQALQQVYQANSYINGRRRCHTCFRSSTLHEVMDQLSDPGTHNLLWKKKNYMSYCFQSFKSICNTNTHTLIAAVRRLVIVDAISKRVEGIISLRDVLEFLLHWNIL